jgi:hypothetical protein
MVHALEWRLACSAPRRSRYNKILVTSGRGDMNWRWCIWMRIYPVDCLTRLVPSEMIHEDLGDAACEIVQLAGAK